MPIAEKFDEKVRAKNDPSFRLDQANELLVTQRGGSSKTTFSVVVPAYQAQATLGPCLAGIISAGFEAEDILVVDDGSSDLTPNIARAFGAKVIKNETNLRPAGARNRGVNEIDTDIVLFVDADVVIKKGIRSRLEAHFRDLEVTAVIGSYDDTPSGGSVISDYRNLLHHHVHQHSGGASQTFWTGIGAVRRDAYLAANGLRGNWENIEDVEFGLRLTAANFQIVLDPNLQGSHLKIWTLGSMFRTDLYGRAVPWSKLIQAGRIPVGVLNTSGRHQLAAAGVTLTGVGLVTALLWLPLAIMALCGILLFLVGIWDFLAFLRQKRGTWSGFRHQLRHR